MKLSSAAKGAAGELRVMSELMLQGFNPAKSYLDNGIDIILENGKKIQVKTCVTLYNNAGYLAYKFSMLSGDGKDKKKIDQVDFLIACVPRENMFYIIPSEKLKGLTGIAIYPNDNKKHKHKYLEYVSNWDLLK